MVNRVYIQERKHTKEEIQKKLKEEAKRHTAKFSVGTFGDAKKVFLVIKSGTESGTEIVELL